MTTQTNDRKRIWLIFIKLTQFREIADDWCVTGQRRCTINNDLCAGVSSSFKPLTTLI